MSFLLHAPCSMLHNDSTRPRQHIRRNPTILDGSTASPQVFDTST
jgi:hypothetical protein